VKSRHNSLAGIVSRNGIILLSRALELSSGQGRFLSDEIIKEATRERIVPIMMTSIVTAIALVPFLLNATAPGKEFLNPLAVVITGGLITSTITSLLFLPVLLARFSSRIKV
jgi:HME family heavy-metal exporter